MYAGRRAAATVATVRGELSKIDGTDDAALRRHIMCRHNWSIIIHLLAVCGRVVKRSACDARLATSEQHDDADRAQTQYVRVYVRFMVINIKTRPPRT